MRKLFFAICFNLFICQLAFSRVTPITGLESLPPVQQPQQKMKITEIDEKDFKKIVEEGFAKAKHVDLTMINKTSDFVSIVEEGPELSNDFYVN